MPPPPENPNLKRRRSPGLLAAAGALLLAPWLWLLRKKPREKNAPLTLFQSYMVGDLYLALPAIKSLAGNVRVQILCRPDCLEILQTEGLEGLAFDNTFFRRPGLRSFADTWGAAWKLRGRLGRLALDFDADPRSAFWLKIAGVRYVTSYARPHARFIDRRFPLPPDAVHQADKNAAVAWIFWERRKLWEEKKIALTPAAGPRRETRSLPILDAATAPWILSCWTRKDTKNWPWDHWDGLLEKMAAARLPLLILDPPDAGADFARFRARWSSRVGFWRGSLFRLAGQVQNAAGVVTADNFLGHMAGYYSKPVLWINGSSDPRHVQPRGPLTRAVQVEPMPCRPCDHRCINPIYKECLHALRVEEVWKAFAALRGAIAGRTEAV